MLSLRALGACLLPLIICCGGNYTAQGTELTGCDKFGNTIENDLSWFESLYPINGLSNLNIICEEDAYLSITSELAGQVTMFGNNDLGIRGEIKLYTFDAVTIDDTALNHELLHYQLGYDVGDGCPEHVDLCGWDWEIAEYNILTNNTDA